MFFYGPFSDGFYLNFISVFGNPQDSLVPNHGALSFRGRMGPVLSVVILILVSQIHTYHTIQCGSPPHPPPASP